MLRLLATLGALSLGIALADAVRADDTPDGIYAVRDKGPGTKVKRNDTGAELILGERLTSKVGVGTIRSSNNSNTRLWLDLRRAGPFHV